MTLIGPPSFKEGNLSKKGGKFHTWGWGHFPHLKVLVFTIFYINNESFRSIIILHELYPEMPGCTAGEQDHKKIHPEEEVSNNSQWVECVQTPGEEAECPRLDRAVNRT